MRRRVTVIFDVDGQTNPNTVKTEMWDYVAKLIRAFNMDHKPDDVIARFPTVRVDVEGAI